ncbi:hypothetical protein L596_021519 [Steinernema carpocapsae]|uniref:Uncharacterized protein n=1 Tax=Steinernema carpocapsae TaxID=34508 RepID=A0A4V5ZZX8_STECR|nr:hypothetical protein L596_021519 [Steinernema carpocapsae]
MGNVSATKNYNALDRLNQGGNYFFDRSVERQIFHLRLELAQVTQNQWWHSFRPETRVVKRKARDYNFQEILQIDENIEFTHVTMSPWKTQNVANPENTVISIETLYEELIPFVLSRLANSFGPTLVVFPQEDWAPVHKFAAAKEIKSLCVNYGPGAELLLPNMQENLAHLTLSCDWPTDTALHLLAWANQEELVKLDFQASNILVSADVISAYVQRWKNAKGSTNIWLEGKRHFEPKDVKHYFNLWNKQTHPETNFCSSENKASPNCLDLVVSEEKFCLVSG